MTSRKCIACGCWHDTVVESDQIDEIIEELQLCRECIVRDCGFPANPEKLIKAVGENWHTVVDRTHTFDGASLIKISLDDKDEDKR